MTKDIILHSLDLVLVLVISILYTNWTQELSNFRDFGLLSALWFILLNGVRKLYSRLPSKKSSLYSIRIVYCYIGGRKNESPKWSEDRKSSWLNWQIFRFDLSRRIKMKGPCHLPCLWNVIGSGYWKIQFASRRQPSFLG